MNNQPLLPEPHSISLARMSYVEAPLPVVLDDSGPSSLLEYWRILRRRKGSLFLIAFTGLLLAVVWTFQQGPVYQARTVLEIQNINENFLNMRAVTPTDTEGAANPLETDLQTQVNILQSNTVLGRVVARPGINARLSVPRTSGIARWRAALNFAPPAAIPTRDDLIRSLSAGLKVSARANTRLVDVLYDSTDPALAADVANALAAEYISQNLQSRWQSSQQTGEWLTQQMEDVRIKLEKSEDQLQAYARASGLLFTSEKDNIAETKLHQLQDELSKAQADRVTRQSKYELASTAAPESLPEVLDSSALKDYQVKLTDLRRQLAEQTASLTPAHPIVKKIQAQVATLEAALERERAAVVGRIRNEFESAQRRERLLASSYDAQARLVTEQSTRVAHYNILKREVDNNRQLYDSMLHHVKEAGIASTLHASNIRIADPATPPRTPYKPSLPVNAAVGLFTGCFLGIAFVVVRERADRSIQAPGEVSLLLDLPELGVIPSANAERSRCFAYYYQKSRLAEANGNGTEAGGEKDRKLVGKTPVELITWKSKPSAVAECFRSTLTSILYSGENGNRPRVIALTSANPQEGKTTVASNLALALAEIGRRVLLIDADLRRPRLHEIFEVPNAWGLTDVLEGRKAPAESDATVIETSYPNLFLLPAGSVPSNISAVLHSPVAMDFLKRMRHEFDMILIDTPPMLHMPDARLLGRMADAVVLVVRSARTTKEAATSVGRRLAQDGTRVLGTILNEWDPRNATQAGYERKYSSVRGSHSGV
jgi:capsular exopolysaccharide synthesis family protein